MADIELVIKISEKEFGIDIANKFQEFFSRLKVEIKEHIITNTNLVCGAYELETIDMFLEAFNNSIPLPKGHGKLKDMGNLKYVFDLTKDNPIYSGKDIEQAIKSMTTIIEADKIESEE